MVVNHPNYRRAALEQSLNHVKVGHFVHVNDLGPKSSQNVGDSFGGAPFGEPKTWRKGLAPSFFAAAGSAAVEQADFMAPPEQLCCGDVNVGLSPAMRA